MSQPGRPAITPKTKALLNTKVLRWYKKHARTLPWRNERDPYRILVSEVMLQQTQVSRVVTKYPLFLKRFPTLKKLAKARRSTVIKAWEGMGYNNRALRLQKLAADVSQQHRGNIPEGIDELLALPGIGRYTAHAMACFSFGQHVPVVDTNIERVLTRICRSTRRTPPTDEELWHLAQSLLPQHRSRDWNQALMDLGATICTAALPKCGLCPVAGLCPSAHRVRRRKSRTGNTEPGRKGIPNRIYRGRVIQALRKLKREETMTRSAIARMVMSDFTPRDRRWFEVLLRSLESDGLIRFRSRNTISLPE